ncbi:MAG: glycosyltransferase [Lachnospiraceae bacterium]|nr:glycosyltransferase [Candidatus Colinaster equi]
MRGYYIHPGSKKVFSGVDKKIRMQMEEFAKLGDIQEIVVEKENSNLFKSICWRLPGGSFGRNYDAALQEIEGSGTPEYIYIRHFFFDRRVIRFLTELRRRYAEAKIIYEIPTFPYKNELLSNIEMLPWYFKDIVYRKKLKQVVDRVVTYSDDEYIYGIPVIRTTNGIDVESIPMVESTNNDCIDIVAVGQFQRAHGYERIICSLAEYVNAGEERERVHLHMVGDGRELPYYKKIAKELDINDYVTFYGYCEGEQLDAVYDEADIALGCFGAYKNGLKALSSLKMCEYIARGLPIVSACPENAFRGAECDFYLEFPNDNSKISMKRIIEWYNDINKKYNDKLSMCKTIRNYAYDKVDMSKVMKVVIDYIQDDNIVN